MVRLGYYTGPLSSRHTLIYQRTRTHLTHTASRATLEWGEDEGETPKLKKSGFSGMEEK